MENEKNLRDNDEMEIDLLQLFYALKKKIWFILAESLYCLGVYQVHSVHSCSLPSINLLQWFIFFQRRRH